MTRSALQNSDSMLYTGIHISASGDSFKKNFSYNNDLAGQVKIRSSFKNVFWPNVFVGASFQILEIQEYSSGLKFGSAATLNQNPIFETASRSSFKFEMASK
jgi:hypothetical protein